MPGNGLVPVPLMRYGQKTTVFVSWQHVKLQNLTLFHLQNKTYHRPQQEPEYDVKPTFQHAKVQTLALQLLQYKTQLILWS